MARDGQEIHLAAVATPLVGDSGVPEGVVLVFDDVTPLIRAQKVAAWREVARRLAHEIKNPLTPIQLCAERLRRHFSTAPPAARALVDECTETIVGEVESLKGLVDEFSQFARMPSPRTVPTDLSQLITDTIALYNGIFSAVQIDQRFAPGLPLVRLDPEQVRRVIINLIDNAIEAMERNGEIVVETQLDSANAIVRVVVADNGPGIPAANATSCSCRITRPSAAAAASAWRSCAGSSRSTAATSMSATTRRGGRVLQSSYRAEYERLQTSKTRRTRGWSVPMSLRGLREFRASMKPTILIVDDEPGVRTALTGRAPR